MTAVNKALLKVNMLGCGAKSERRSAGNRTGATWISSKRRAYHVYAGLYELDEFPGDSGGMGESERVEGAGIWANVYGPEGAATCISFLAVDRWTRATVVDTTHRDTTTTLFFLTRPPA